MIHSLITKPMTLTNAQRFAAIFDENGARFRPMPEFEDQFEDMDFEEIGKAIGARVEREIVGTGNMTRLTFGDGSIIISAEACWDYGFANCWCMAGCLNDECDCDHE